jgi:hypothetical protein
MTFKRRKKTLAWDDLILLETDEIGVIRQIKTLPEK